MEHVVDIECRVDELRLNPNNWQTPFDKKNIHDGDFLFLSLGKEYVNVVRRAWTFETALQVIITWMWSRASERRDKQS